MMHPTAELDALAEEHRRWLSPFDAQYVRNWEKLYKSDFEGAMTEAGIRRMLEGQDVRVEPNERLKGKCGGPDFRCHVANRQFYVEVTCVSKGTAERRINLKRVAGRLPSFNVTGMVEAVFAECMNKAPQCGNLDAPALVAVGTFHTTAAMTGFKKPLVNMVLTGKAGIAWNIDASTRGRAGPTCQATRFERAAFLRLDNSGEPTFARCSISGILLCGIGLRLRGPIGVLHPNPARPFEPMLLPGIEFGRVEVDHCSGQLIVRWPRLDA